MGYYIKETPKRNLPNIGKAQCLIDDCQAKKISVEEAENEITGGKDAVVCVINNGFFDAAGLVYDKNEFIEFTLPMDMRKRTFLKMDKQLAHKLSGYKMKGD